MKSFKQHLKEGKPTNIALSGSSTSSVSIPTVSDPSIQTGKGSHSKSGVAQRGTGLGFDNMTKAQIDKVLKDADPTDTVWHAVNKLAAKIHYDDLMKRANRDLNGHERWMIWTITRKILRGEDDDSNR